MCCTNVFISGSNLKFYMDQKDVTVIDLSIGTGISTRTIQRYRNESRNPRLEDAYAIARYLHMDLKQIWCVFDKM